jgi:hypothetical protein
MTQWLECQNPECRQVFAAERPSRMQNCCSRYCARRLEAIQREPAAQDKIEALLRAIRVELEKVIK